MGRKKKEPLEFTGEDIIPDISDEENKRRIENFVDTLYRINKVKNYSHCIYTKEAIHIYIFKE